MPPTSEFGRPHSLKARLHDQMDGRDVHTTSERTFVAAMSALIIVNTIAVILETEPEVYVGREAIFRALEVFSVGVFSVEYLIRLWACTVEPRYSHPVWGRFRYVFSFMGLVDLAAVLPFYLPRFGADLRLLRLFRLVRFGRVLKLGRYTRAMQIFQRVVMAKRAELYIAFAITSVLLVIAASLMYFAERVAQPGAFSSILSSMWWAVMTMTTVGYGDV